MSVVSEIQRAIDEIPEQVLAALRQESAAAATEELPDEQETTKLFAIEPALENMGDLLAQRFDTLASEVEELPAVGLHHVGHRDDACTTRNHVIAEVDVALYQFEDCGCHWSVSPHWVSCSGCTNVG